MPSFSRVKLLHVLLVIVNRRDKILDTLKKVGKVILWIFFWYYLIPYYLLKKYAFKQVKHRVFWSSLSSLVVVFVLFCWWGSTIPDDDSTQAETTKPKIHYVVKKVGRKELAQAKAKEKVLNKEEKKEKTEYEKLSAALAAAKAKDKKGKAAKIKAEKKVNEEAKQQNNAVSKSHTSTQTNTSRSHHTTGAAASNHGDMNIAQTGKIVGNHNSKIYHVPGQAGYRMNFANAVYFNSEAEAKAAGYRKSLR